MQLGWVDFSKDDRQKVFDVMNLLQEQGAVDELGIGIVRDAFANYFFPGTSTIQTRAKYFLIVSYLLKEAGDGKYGNDLHRILSAMDEEEKRCGNLLLDKDPSAEGIVGKRVLPKGWVTRKPSDIYWNGIRTFGIFKENSLSISEYIRIATKLRAQKNNVKLGNRGDDNKDLDCDDVDAGDIISYQFWDLPIYKETWRDNLSIELTLEEAEYLKKQIMKHAMGKLLWYILHNHIDLEGYDSFAALTEALKDKVPSDMSYMMKLACDFNNLVYMARVRYNVILSEGNNADANAEWDGLVQNIGERANVDLQAVFEKMNIYNPKAFAFLNMLQEFFKERKIDEADELIKKREVQLKGISRAKLNHIKEHNSDVWVGGGWLDFRFFDARRIVNDIYHGR